MNPWQTFACFNDVNRILLHPRYVRRKWKKNQRKFRALWSALVSGEVHSLPSWKFRPLSVRYIHPSIIGATMLIASRSILSRKQCWLPSMLSTAWVPLPLTQIQSEPTISRNSKNKIGTTNKFATWLRVWSACAAVSATSISSTACLC